MTAIVKPSAANLLLHREISEISEGDAHIKVPSQLPTPLIGRWADESFPLNSRQASEIVQEQAVQRQRSSIVFEDANGNEFSYADPNPTEIQDGEEVSSAEYDNSELAEKLSIAQGSNDDISLGSPTHVTRCYRFDPYNLSSGGVDVMYCCYCERCNAMVNAANAVPTFQAPMQADADAASYLMSGSNAAALQLMEPVLERPIVHHIPQQQAGRHSNFAPRGLGASPDNSSMSSNSYAPSDWDAPYPQRRGAPPQSRTAFATHMTQHSARAPAQPEQGPLLSSFMPPPPPPRIMTLVLEEEGNRRASSIYYHLLTRWYNHVAEAQEFFVAEEEYCPAPNKDMYSFDEWADRVSGWWYTHFEGMQKKPSRYPTRRI